MLRTVRSPRSVKAAYLPLRQNEHHNVCCRLAETHAVGEGSLGCFMRGLRRVAPASVRIVCRKGLSREAIMHKGTLGRANHCLACRLLGFKQYCLDTATITLGILRQFQHVAKRAANDRLDKKCLKLADTKANFTSYRANLFFRWWAAHRTHRLSVVSGTCPDVPN